MFETVTGEFVLKTTVFAPIEPFRQELLAFVRSIPGLELIDVAAEPGELLVCVQQAAPQLLIIVGAPGLTSVIEPLRHAGMRSSLFCLVLAENRQQIQQALAAGADAVLLKGFSTHEFLATLAQITKGTL